MLTVYLTVMVACCVGMASGGDSCAPYKGCNPCLRTPGCAWCSDRSYQASSNGTSQCFEASGKSTCDPESIVNFKNEAFVTVAKELGSQISPGSKETVVLSPQEMVVKLRKGVPLDVAINYLLPKDLPLDLYLLMDVSLSMDDDLENIKLLADKLIALLNSISSDSAIGFGSFVDKAIAPYSSFKYDESWKEKGPGPMYGFRNLMRLSTNITQFKQSFATVAIEDRMEWNGVVEGASDAIEQALVCTKEIGWRAASRKMLMVVTDAESHWETGRLDPNDGKCHLSPEGEYTMSLTMDFPSKTLINKLAIENSVSIVFAVTKDVKPVWELTSAEVVGSVVGVVARDSSNIVALVEEQAKVLSSSVVLAANGVDAVTTSFRSDCGKPGSEISTDGCHGLTPGTEVSFTATLTLAACPADRRSWRAPLTVSTVGLNDSLNLDVSMLCDCFYDDKTRDLERCVDCTARRRWTDAPDCSKACGSLTPGSNFHPLTVEKQSDCPVKTDGSCAMEVSYLYKYNAAGQVDVSMKRGRVCS